MITNIDLAVLRFVESLHNPATDFFFSMLTKLGVGFWIATGILLMCFPRHRKTGITVLLGLIAFHIIGNTGLKNIIARPRPYILAPELLEGIPAAVSVPSSFSMPSGHTMSAFVTATILARNYKKAALPIYILACLMGLSRIYLLVHYPTDVLVGAALGIVLAVITDKAVTRLYRLRTT